MPIKEGLGIMGSYSCPTCGEEVEPVGWQEAGEAPLRRGDADRGGEQERDPGRVAHETRRCPGCDTRLARTPPGNWYESE
jgi:hypothetical protein